MKPLRNLIFHQYFLSVEFFRGPHLVHSRWNYWEDWSYIDIFCVEFFKGPHFVHFRWNLENLVFHRYFLSVEFFRGPHSTTFSMKLLGSLVFLRYFQSVEFSRCLHLVHFDETLEKFDLSSIFSMCGIFQRSTLNTFSMKLLRSSDFHRCFLNVDFSRSSHLVYFDETFEKFDLSSIFS